ncbi:hypothetical protein [Duganella sp. BuS-21]|uniref:hypothetical protein n=1 Tax=Duganella sp. BuS-21 TaxID=2943848 RepID=UPI0035A61199
MKYMHFGRRTGNNRKNLVRAVEESLNRMNTDHIDLLWAHMADGTPLDDILRGSMTWSAPAGQRQPPMLRTE